MTKVGLKPMTPLQQYVRSSEVLLTSPLLSSDANERREIDQKSAMGRIFAHCWCLLGGPGIPSEFPCFDGPPLFLFSCSFGYQLFQWGYIGRSY